MLLYTCHRFREVSPFRSPRQGENSAGVSQASLALQPGNRAVKRWMARSEAASLGRVESDTRNGDIYCRVGLACIRLVGNGRPSETIWMW